MAAVDQGTVLTAFSRTLERDVHALTRQPDLLWQQMYNHLQWEDPHLRKHLIFEQRCHRREPMSLLPNQRSHTMPLLPKSIPFLFKNSLPRTGYGENSNV